MTTTSPKQHKRGNTYEGPQMNFKFPSEEELERIKLVEPESRLEGPQVKPFYQYEQSKSPASSTARLHQQQSPQHYHVRSKDMNFFAHPSSDYTNSVVDSSNYSSTSSEASIPTQSNVTTLITGQSDSMFTTRSVESRSGTVRRRPSLAPRAGSIRRTSSVMQRRQLANNVLKTGGLQRSVTVRNASKNSATLSEEDTSLYEKGSSLKRSKAVKYSVGWLTRLKQMGSRFGKKFKKWRLVSLKKVFKFSRAKSMKVKKLNISMPLERERAQSISELRMATDDWSQPNCIAAMGSIPHPPPPQISNRVVSASTASLVNSIADSIARPPVPPPHRIASNRSMQQLINDQETRREFEMYPDTQPALRDPMDQHYRHTLLQEVEVQYPSHPATVYDDDTGFLEDSFDDDSDAETLADDDDKEQELMLREYWGHYLRSVVAHRIQTKLEFYALSQIPEPEKHDEYAEEMFGSLSDLDVSSSEQFESGNDTDSLTSVSSNDVSESSSLPSNTSTNYFSAYDGPVATPLDIMRYQLAYKARYRDVMQVKRASTLPLNADKDARHNAYEVQHPQHMRFLSVVQ